MINSNLEYNGYIFKGLLVGLFVPFCLAGTQETDFLPDSDVTGFFKAPFLLTEMFSA